MCCSASPIHGSNARNDCQADVFRSSRYFRYLKNIVCQKFKSARVDVLPAAKWVQKIKATPNEDHLDNAMTYAAVTDSPFAYYIQLSGYRFLAADLQTASSH
jgi:hypothetical protein